MKKTRSKKDQIIALLKIGKKPSFIAKEVGVPVQTVYSTNWLMKKATTKKTYTVTASNTDGLNVVKKRGRPPKQGRDDEIRRLITVNMQLMQDNKFLVGEVENLRHQVTGFRAVISYLENQVGLRNSQ